MASEKMFDVSVLMTKVMALHDRLGLPSVKLMPGEIWTHQLDDHWFIAVNANKESVKLGPPDGMLVEVHAFSVAVWFNGWYAGEFDTYDGFMAAGSEANEDTLIAALEHAT